MTISSPSKLDNAYEANADETAKYRVRGEKHVIEKTL